MSKGKRYKKSEKRFANFFLFYLVILCFVFVNYTFSRYTATTNVIPTTNAAKFYIQVNDGKLGEQETFNIDLGTIENTINNKISPDSNGKFDIVINPDTTQVSLEYDIKIDLSNIKETPVNAKGDKINVAIIGYSLNEESEVREIQTIIENGITMYQINGEINLSDSKNENKDGFIKEDQVTIKVYWKWEQDIENPTFSDNITNRFIKITTEIKQKI